MLKSINNPQFFKNVLNNSKMDNNKKPLQQMFEERGNKAEAIVEFLKGLTVQECLSTLDAAKRMILNNTKT